MGKATTESLGSRKPSVANQFSAVIPCYNEEATILEILERVRKASPAPSEIVVVDDFSTDSTRVLLEKELKAGRIHKLHFQDKNYGKGAALRKGFSLVSTPYCIIQDADLEYSPKDYARVMGPLLEGEADAVYGSRFRGSDRTRVLYFWHYMGNKFLTLLSNSFTNLNLTDMETCYKAFRTDVIQNLPLKENRFGFEPEVTAKLARVKGLRIYEVGISYAGRTYQEGKKIGWKDGFRAIHVIVKYGLFVRRG